MHESCPTISAGLRVPGGFAVATDAYALHLQASGLGETIRRILSGIDIENVADEEVKSAELRAAIISRPMPAAVEDAIRAAYRLMSPHDDLPVAVRSSATAEDMPDASFAGQQDTYLWVVGADEVIEKVRACWASLFNARAISYRAKRILGHGDALLMSVAVQKMVDAAAAGVAMTLDPINGDRTKIVIDSAFGLGEPVVSGEITPDNFVVEKVLLEITRRRIAEKDHELVAIAPRGVRSIGSSNRSGGHSPRSRTKTSLPSRGSPSSSKNAWADHRTSNGRSIANCPLERTSSHYKAARKRSGAGKPAGLRKRPMRRGSRACSEPCSRR